MGKKFLITIDTEGDNLWAWTDGDIIKTENAKFIPRFQELCEKYGFKPVYLTNYEMAQDEFFVRFAKDMQDSGLCEIGMHLHAWNTPPMYELSKREDRKAGAPYLIEYPYEIMEKKIGFMTELLEEKFGKKVVSHRAGRWAIDERYIDLLDKYGYLVDCSYTPGIDWKSSYGFTQGSVGSDYRNVDTIPSLLKGKLWEYPVTLIQSHKLFVPEKKNLYSIARAVKHFVAGNHIWIRPNGNNLKECLYLVNYCKNSVGYDYAMFMLHSSEMMPGGSPAFSSKESVERLYCHLEQIFCMAQRLGYEGATFRELV